LVRQELVLVIALLNQALTHCGLVLAHLVSGGAAVLIADVCVALNFFFWVLMLGFFRFFLGFLFRDWVVEGHHVVKVALVFRVLPLLFDIDLFYFFVIVAVLLALFLVHVLVYDLIEALLIITLILVDERLLLLPPFWLLNIALDLPILLAMILDLITIFQHLQLPLDYKDLGQVLALGLDEMLQGQKGFETLTVAFLKQGAPMQL
jgi:hypothetical protein